MRRLGGLRRALVGIVAVVSTALVLLPGGYLGAPSVRACGSGSMPGMIMPGDC
jgi:hypothetical protein